MQAKSPGPVNTVPNNTNTQTEGDLERAAAAKPYTGPDFHALNGQMCDLLSTLRCAWLALDSCAVVDADDDASKARNVVLNVEKNLQRLMNDLEVWEMRTRRGRKEVANV